MSDSKSVRFSEGLRIDPQPTTLAVTAYHDLRRDIRSGHLAPGQPLRTEWLKTQYKTGVGPLREALARLAAEHLVTAKGKRGFRVSEISEDDFDQLIDIRDDLEARALKLAIKNGDDDWGANIVATYHLMTKTSPPCLTEYGCREEEREFRHRAFHIALVSACGSRWQMRFVDHLTGHLERYRRIMTPRSTMTDNVAQEIEDEHQFLIKMAIARDANAALQVLHVHRRRAYAAIKRAFSCRGEKK